MGEMKNIRSPLFLFLLLLLAYIGFKESIEKAILFIVDYTLVFFKPNTATDIIAIAICIGVIYFSKKTPTLKSNSEKIIYIVKYAVIAIIYLLYRFDINGKFPVNNKHPFIFFDLIPAIAYLDLLILTLLIINFKFLFRKEKINDTNPLANSKLKPDTHIKKVEHDTLKRNSFAKDIALGITESFHNKHDSLVIALNGEWGTGKSSLFELIKINIDEIYQNKPEKETAYKLIDFNPWMFTGQEQMQGIFLNQLAEQIKEVGNEKELSDKLIELSQKIEKINEENPDPISKTIVGFISKFINLFNDTKSLKTLKKEINDIIIEKDIRLYIFIDDIDRLLSAKEIVEILKLVNLNADFKNTIFLLAIDKALVSEIISKKYNQKGGNYLDKIIQIDYTLPKLTDDELKENFIEEIKNVLQDTGVQQETGEVWFLERAWNDGLKNYFKTLRDNYRFSNALRLRLRSIYKEVNIKDFIILEAIRMFDYEAYDWIYDNRLLLTMSYRGQSHKNIDDEMLSSVTNESTKTLIKGLFKEYVPSSKYNYEELKIGNYIFIAENTSKYFTFKLNPVDISTEHLELFLSTEDFSKKEKLLKHIISLKKFNELCSSLKAKIGIDRNIPDSYKKDLFKIFSYNWGLLQTNDLYTAMTSNSEFNIMIQTLNALCLSYQNKELGMEDYYKTIVENGKYDFQNLYLTYYLKNIVEGVDVEENQLREIFSHDFLIKRRDNILQYYQEALKNTGEYRLRSPEKHKNFELHFVIRTFLIENREKYDELIKKLIGDKNQKSILKMLEICLHWAMSGIMYYNLANDKIKYPQFSIELFESLLTDPSDKSLDKHEKDLMNLFQRLKAEKFPTNKAYSLGDLKEFPM